MNSETTRALLERLHGRDPAHVVAVRQVGVRVHVDLREHDVTRLGLALEHRPQHAAGPAPLGPEVDDHGHLVGALDHLALEFGRIDVDRHRTFVASCEAVGGAQAVAAPAERPHL